MDLVKEFRKLVNIARFTLVTTFSPIHFRERILVAFAPEKKNDELNSLKYIKTNRKPKSIESLFNRYINAISFKSHKFRLLKTFNTYNSIKYSLHITPTNVDLCRVEIFPVWFCSDKKCHISTAKAGDVQVVCSNDFYQKISHAFVQWYGFITSHSSPCFFAQL